MIISISQDLSLFSSKRLDISWASSIHRGQKLWPFEFVESFHCSISSISIYYAPESDLRVKSYDHLNFSRASIVTSFHCHPYFVATLFCGILIFLTLFLCVVRLLYSQCLNFNSFILLGELLEGLFPIIVSLSS